MIWVYSQLGKQEASNRGYVRMMPKEQREGKALQKQAETKFLKLCGNRRPSDKQCESFEEEFETKVEIECNHEWFVRIPWIECPYDTPHIMCRRCGAFNMGAYPMWHYFSRLHISRLCI